MIISIYISLGNCSLKRRINIFIIHFWVFVNNHFSIRLKTIICSSDKKNNIVD